MNAKRPVDYWVLWAVALVSLAINLLLVNVLLTARRQVGEAASVAAQAMSDLRESAIDYTVHVEEAIPVAVTVTYSNTISVPISVTLPISTQVSVPLRTPLGEFPLTFPVRASIPLNIRPKVPISLEVPVSAVVPVVIDVPIHVALKDTPFGAPLADARRYLASLAEDLGSATATPTTPADEPGTPQ